MASPRLPIDAQRRNLGERRLQEHMENNALMNFMLLTLNMGILTAPQTGYSDEALDTIKVDASDLRKTAETMASWAEDLADHWRAQRQEHDGKS
jgi:hypothetical protein